MGLLTIVVAAFVGMMLAASPALAHIMSDGEWKPIRINVQLK